MKTLWAGGTWSHRMAARVAWALGRDRLEGGEALCVPSLTHSHITPQIRTEDPLPARHHAGH